MEWEKKRILYIITKSNFGGAQRYVFELATAMRDRGHAVAVAVGGYGVLAEKLASEGVEVFSIATLERDVRLTKEWPAFASLVKIIRDWKPDIVHLNSPKAGGLGALAARINRVPKIIFTAHGWAFLESRNMLWKWLAWIASFFTVLLVHKVIAVSKNDRVRAPMFFLEGRCEVIQTAVPHFDMHERDVAREMVKNNGTANTHKTDVWLVSIAELTQNKNLEVGIRAVAEFNKTHQQRIFYSIIGEGELRETLSGIIREENAESYIELLGYIENARSVLKAFDIFLLPSKKEGMPYAILEAGIAGLPVIASNVGGIPEVIEHEKTGALIDPHNHVTILKALKSLIHDTELRMRVSEALMSRVRTMHDLKSMIEKTEKVYLE